MTKQEEIREVLNTLCCVAKAKDLAKSPTGFDDDVDRAMRELSDLDVVLKVDRELPNVTTTDSPHYRTEAFQHGVRDYKEAVRNAGCGFFEPLIGGEK